MTCKKYFSSTHISKAVLFIMMLINFITCLFTYTNQHSSGEFLICQMQMYRKYHLFLNPISSINPYPPTVPGPWITCWIYHSPPTSVPGLTTASVSPTSATTRQEDYHSYQWFHPQLCVVKCYVMVRGACPRPAAARSHTRHISKCVACQRGRGGWTTCAWCTGTAHQSLWLTVVEKLKIRRQIWGSYSTERFLHRNFKLNSP